MAQTKTCPNCNRPVPVNVPRCPYCRSSLTQKSSDDTPKQTSIKNARLNALLHGESYTEEVFSAPVSKEEQPQSRIEDIFVSTTHDDVISTLAASGQEPTLNQPADPKFDASADNSALEKRETEKKNRKEKRSIFGKKQKSQEEKILEEIPKDSDDEAYEDNGFDANSDGYYDDVLPELAEQINRLPTENAIRIIFTLLLVIALLIIAFSAI